MLVKDQITGKRIDKETAFKVEKVSETGKITNTYYSSEEAYNKYNEEKELRKKCISEVYDTLGYQTFMKMPSQFFKYLKDWEGYGYDVVLDCIQTNKDRVMYILDHKNFSSESLKVSYVCGIYNNSMNDSYKKIRELSKNKQNIKSESIEIEDINVKKQKTKDISAFLEDDD